MRRREFIALVGGAAVSPMSARAQQRLPTVGFLGAGTPASWGRWTEAFVSRLSDLGWVEGRTVKIEYRWAEGRNERYDEIAPELIQFKVDVIVTAEAAVPAIKRVTSTIPVVLALSRDPVGSGAIASLARPGGNVTGLSNQSPDIVGKRLSLLRDVIPDLRRLAILANVGNTDAVQEVGEVRVAAKSLGMETITLEVRRDDELAAAFNSAKGRAEAAYILGDPLVTTNRLRINILALGARLPTLSSFREYVEAGGLISYGANFPALFRRAAEYVDKILRGTKPADIPVEQPTKFDLVVNLTTAKSLGLTIPEAFLLRADEVIE